MPRVLSEAAQVAALIKAEAKRLGIPKCSARSSYFANGNSVDVTVPKDTGAKLFERLRLFAEQHTAGWFDGMTDSYNYKPNTYNRPRAKYVSVYRDWRD